METLQPEDISPFFDGIREKYGLDLRQYEYAQSLIFSLRVEGNAPEKIEDYQPLLAPIVCRNEQDLREFRRDFRTWARQRGRKVAVDPISPDLPVETVGHREEGDDEARKIYLIIVTVALLAVAAVIWIGLTNDGGGPIVIDDPPPPLTPLNEDTPPEEGLFQGLNIRFLSAAIVAFIPIALAIAGFMSMRTRRRAYINTGTVERASRHLMSLQRTDLNLFDSLRSEAMRMRRWIRQTVADLDMPKTALATAQRAGLFTPVYQQRAMSRSYLVLIDARSGKDHLPALWDPFIEALMDEGVAVDRYFYVDDPRRVYRSRELTEPVTLDELIGRHRDGHLLLLGDAFSLVDELSGRIKPWARLLKETWPLSVVLTPRVNPPWGDVEASLSRSGFLVVPSTETGIKFVAAVMESFAHDNSDRLGKLAEEMGRPLTEELPEILRRDSDRWLVSRGKPPADTDALIAALRDYLGDFAFRWVCACAVFPTIRWTVTSFLGERLAARQERPIGVDDFALLLTLPWFRAGRMPGYLRVRLMYELQDSEEYDVRADLIDLIQKTLDNPVNATYLTVATEADEDLDDDILDLVNEAPEGSLLGDPLLLRFLDGSQVRSTDLEVPGSVLQRPDKKKGWQSLKPAVRNGLLLTLAGVFGGALWYAEFDIIAALAASIVDQDWYYLLASAQVLLAFTTVAWVTQSWIRSTTDPDRLKHYTRAWTLGPLSWRWPIAGLTFAGILVFLLLVTDWLASTQGSFPIQGGASGEIEEIVVDAGNDLQGVTHWDISLVVGFIVLLLLVPFRKPRPARNPGPPGRLFLDLAQRASTTYGVPGRVYRNALLAHAIYLVVWVLLFLSAETIASLITYLVELVISEGNAELPDLLSLGYPAGIIYGELGGIVRFALTAWLVLKAIQPVWAPYGDRLKTFLLIVVSAYFVGSTWGGGVEQAIWDVVIVVDFPISLLGVGDLHWIDFIALRMGDWLAWIGAAVAGIVYLQYRGSMNIATCRMLLRTALVLAIIQSVAWATFVNGMYDFWYDQDLYGFIVGLANSLDWFLLYVFGSRALTGRWFLPRWFPGSTFVGFLAGAFLLGEYTDSFTGGMLQLNDTIGLDLGSLVIAPILLSRFAGLLTADLAPIQQEEFEGPAEPRAALYLSYLLSMFYSFAFFTAIYSTIAYVVLRKNPQRPKNTSHHLYLLRTCWMSTAVFVFGILALAGASVFVSADLESILVLIVTAAILINWLWLIWRCFMGMRLLNKNGPAPYPLAWLDPNTPPSQSWLARVLAGIGRRASGGSSRGRTARNKDLTDLIAFQNSISHLTRVLGSWYGQSQSEISSDEANRRLSALQSQLHQSRTELDKRRVIARTIVSEMPASRFFENDLLPADLDLEQLIQPEAFVAAIRDHIAPDIDTQNPVFNETIENHLQGLWSTVEDQRTAERQFYNELDHTATERGRAHVVAIWLVMARGLDERWFRASGYLPANYQPSRLRLSTAQRRSFEAEAVDSTTGSAAPEATTKAGPADSTQNSKRWSSQRMFTLAVAGSAISLGNIWQFPYVMAENGGGIFLGAYLLCLLLIAAPLLMAELALGRAGRMSPVNAMRALANLGGRRRLGIAIGWLAMITGFLTFTYFSALSGWPLYYSFSAAAGSFVDISGSESQSMFTDFIGSIVPTVASQLVIVVWVAVIAARGLRRGLESALRWLVISIFVLIGLLIAYALIFGDFVFALEYMFDFSTFTTSELLVAARQAFFTIAVCSGAMMVYGAYAPEEASIRSTAATVLVLDTLVSLAIGVALFAVLFAAGLDPTSGSTITFIAAPVAYGALPLGQLATLLFYVLVVVCALSSLVALAEPSIAFLTESFGRSRKMATLLVAVAGGIIGFGSLLSFNAWSDVTIIGSRTFFDSLDYLTSNLLLPVCALLLAIYVGYGNGQETLKQQLGLGAFGKTVQLLAFRVIVPLLAIYMLFTGY